MDSSLKHACACTQRGLRLEPRGSWCRDHGNKDTITYLCRSRGRSPRPRLVRRHIHSSGQVTTRARAHTQGGMWQEEQPIHQWMRSTSAGPEQQPSGDPGVTLRVSAVMETGRQISSGSTRSRAWLQPTCLQVQRDPGLVDVRRVALGADPPDRSAVPLLLRGCRHVRLPGSVHRRAARV